MIEVQEGQLWMTAGWRQVPSFVTVKKVENDEVEIELSNGLRSSLSQSAFLRTYSFYPDLVA